MTRSLRCAIYTRKSSEEGLDQDFNSLDAQREACGAYVCSQAGEGWQALSTRYDDGGYSGGSLDRPGLRRLLDDIAARRVDVVVVYKVDRLTRSLADFAKIVDVLDAAGASFVSVTQAFNTTTSMGRLTLNVLLSFAQFEREVTGERIRDKIALSKAKGMWMGGVVPLGYDLDERRLVINPQEAALVRHIFDRYLELGSINRLRDELETSGVRSKQWVTRSGRTMGGAVFNRGGVHHVLRNPLYVGEIAHKGVRHPGLHPPIVERAVFEAVAQRLGDQAAAHRATLSRTASSPLVGRVFDAEGEPMAPSFGYSKNGRRYRYYISKSVQQGRRPSTDGVIRRVGAPAVERFCVDLLARISGFAIDVEKLSSLIQRLELRRDETHLMLVGEQLFPDRHPATMLDAAVRRLEAGEVVAWHDEERAILRLIGPYRLQLRGGRTWITSGDAPARRRDAGLIDALRSSHAELRDLQASPLTPPQDLSNARAPATMHRRQLARLPFLAPDLQTAVLQGLQPNRLKLRTLLKSELPLLWTEQRAWFEGFDRS